MFLGFLEVLWVSLLYRGKGS